MAENNKNNAAAAYHIVAIGASAGGLEALESLFDSMPPDSNLAFIIIQHLSPTHKSSMDSLLSRHTAMPVRHIEDGMPVKPNCIYLNPPNTNVTLLNRILQLLPLPKTHGLNMPIDFFFRALAKDQGEKAVGVILSGTASDGTLGIKAIKGEGGMVMVQEPETAKYDGMPKNAIATGMVDFVLPVEKMPDALAQYVRHPAIESPDQLESSEIHFQNHMQKIFALIKNASGHDFSNYKQNTIRRRIERRLAVHQIDNLSDYISYLQNNPKEIQTLFKDMLIGVTGFFRDAKAYETLEKEALIDLLKEKNPDAQVRVWVVGCSTGEEAYSMGILISDIMEKLNKRFNIKIFASDIDEKAIEVARTGLYPKSIAADVSAKRLNRFFTKEDDFFKVKKHLREMVVFSLQNIIKDPPFSRLDLVSCRNLMIYMDPVLQKKIIPIFYYTLNPGGLLFLGTSESIGEKTDLFKTVNPKWKIFVRKEGRVNQKETALLPETYDKPHPAGPEIKPAPQRTDIQSAAEKIILDEYAPCGVVIDHHYEIIHFIGKTDKYLVPPVGKASFNIMQMVRDEIRYKLSALLQKAGRLNQKCTTRDIRI